MVVTVEARKFSLPHLPLSSPQVNSFLYEPNSQSLALTHSDSTFSLFPSFSPFGLSAYCNSLPFPQTLISPPSSSACFVSLNPNSQIQDCPDDKNAVFVTAGPHKGGSRVLLRFYLLGKDGKFVNVHVGCSQNGVSFDKKLGVIVDLSHGLKVFLCGSVNYLAMYSASGGEMWVFGLKLMGSGRDLRLVKCAVVECRLPVSTICMSSGFLIMGEVGGVRVFPLRVLVKGRVKSRRKLCVAKGKGGDSNGVEEEVSVKVEIRNCKMPNGVVRPFHEGFEFDKNLGNSKLLPNGHASSAINGVSSSSNVDGTVKPRSLKFRQDSGARGMQFVVFHGSVHEEVKMMRWKTTKAISIQAVSQEKFLILDSHGALHVLHMSKSGSSRMMQLSCSIQVQKLAAFPDASADSQTIWISDGLYSLHTMVIPSSGTTEKEHDGSNNEGKINQNSVTQAIFTSERIQDMMPLTANRVLILGQDSLYAYAIS